MKYLAIDPGAGRSKSIGYAFFDADGAPELLGQCTFDELIELMEEHKEELLEVIYEGYVIRRKNIRSHIGSKAETIQTIGAIRAFCKRSKINVIEQPSGILTMAQKHFGINIEQNGHSNSHQYAALLHGLHYLHSIGKPKALTVLEREVAATKRGNKTN
jgi:hypothetical protein